MTRKQRPDVCYRWLRKQKPRHDLASLRGFEVFQA
jgi:hypothetical protein